MKGKIFSGQEVQAIISGNKTMFREVIKAQPNSEINPVYLKECNSWQWATKESRRECPYQVGQKIFCKESFVDFRNNNSDIFYKSDFDLNNLVKTVDLKWKPAQHMKKEQSRITLEITGIKVERLAEISKEDAIKEGATSRPNCHGYANRYEGWCMNWNKVGEASKWASNRKTLSESDVCMGSAQYAFGNFWNATHKKLEEKWEANPWVFAYEFEIINN